MATNKTGVFPCYENQFQAGESKETLHNIADMETFSVAIDNNIEEWKPYDQLGWARRLLTGKSITISAAGKRNYGDDGNDYVASKAMAEGREAEGCFQWSFPDGTKFLFENAVFNITAFLAADSTNVAPLEFDALSNGKPQLIAATEPASLNNESAPASVQTSAKSAKSTETK